ncbi:single-stranded DNA-binding protein [Thermodesulfobacterium thermophilum]|uniref:single-stranded DNA-binding protein n=1 Tax=Thermodesulfobacterium thermophilum TaxID=886 RepID=UPI0003B4D867|nr:single-stranded DNA-binding protein [Thermodesulfobacterium thermophilum]
MSINKVILIGRLGADPEIRYTVDGKPVVSFRLATNEVIVRNGEKEVLTEWHRVVAFGRLAEICGEYLSKGSQVYIEGKLRTRKFEDKQGMQRYVTEIVAQNMQILDKKSQSPDDATKSYPVETSPKVSKKATDLELDALEEPLIDEEDIPF